MAKIRIAEPERRDRLLLISAFAMALLTMLGAAGESLGMDRLLKSNTSKTRTHSLFRQGCMLYELIPNMPQHRLLPLMQRFANCWSAAGCLANSSRRRNEGMAERFSSNYGQLVCRRGEKSVPAAQPPHNIARSIGRASAIRPSNIGSP